ncbi:MAG: type III pantothenate kinase [Rickettsiales bacterium]
MLLAIDVGNTNTVFALFDEDNLVGHWRISTIAGRTSDEYWVWLRQLLEEHGVNKRLIHAAIVATVVPETQYEILTLCQRYFGVQALLVGSPDVKLNIEIKIDRPQEVGADRLVNAVEAWRRYKQSCIVVDFGTATTFDVVDSDGNYCGGVIAPGVHLSLDALRRAAAKLPGIRIRRPDKVIGTTTVGAMESGMFFGYVSLIDGIATRIKAEYGKPMKVVATGGLATLYAKASEVIDETEEDLTIFGLHTIYKINS